MGIIRATIRNSIDQTRLVVQSIENPASPGNQHREATTVLDLGKFRYSQKIAGDLDLFLIMDGTFSVEESEPSTHVIFDSVLAKLLFEAYTFWARETVGEEVIQLWLETYQVTRDFGKRDIVELELR